MLSEKITDTASEQITLAFAEQDEHLALEYGKLISNFAKRGVLGSSMDILAVLGLYKNAIKVRADMARGLVLRAVESYGVDHLDTLADDLKSFLTETIENETERLKARMNERPSLKRSRAFGSALGPDTDAPMEEAAQYAIRKMITEVDLLVATLQRTQTAVSEDTPSSISVFGNVGSIQTGSFSTASVTQVLDSGTKAHILQALEQVADALREHVDSKEFNAGELLEMTEDGKVEVSKDTPNVSRVRATLSGIAQAIQTSAAMKPAYEGIKGVLAYCGISLP